MRTLFLCFTAELFSLCAVLAQEQKEITAQLSNVSFEEFVNVAGNPNFISFFLRSPLDG